jgi:glycosyltransferase involved in cell wall biosynthesis
LGGPRESQVDGKTGFLVSLEPGAFAQAMARLVADEKLVRIMGHAARENARQYDWSHFVDRIDLVLEKLVGSVR